MKYYFPAHYRTFDRLYEKALEYIKNNNLSDLKTLNNIHNLRLLQSILCLAGETDVIPDGVLGPKTKTAIKEKLGVDDITKVDDNVLKKLIDDASANVKATNMSFEADGFKVDGAAAGTTDANTGTNAGTNADATSGATDGAKTSLLGGTSVDLKGLKEWLLKNKVFKGAIGTVRDQSKRTLRVSSDNTKNTVDINSDLLGNYDGIADIFNYSPKK